MGLLESIRDFIPEIVLVVEALIILIIAMTKNGKRFAGLFALMGLVTAFILLLSVKHTALSDKDSASMFNSMVLLNHFTVFFKGLCIAVTLCAVLFSIGYHRFATEYYAILLLATVGMCLMASANDLLIAYIGIETVSISSYILTASLKGNKKSSEAGLKYVIYGAIASGIMIYGMSFLYGLTGHTNFEQINVALLGSANSPALLVITLMILAGFAYKIAAVPLHMWCPDVYEGAPTPITAFLSVGPKAAGFAILLNFLLKIFSHIPYDSLQTALIIICVLTMTIGNLGALKQTNIKRLLAYSSIAHCGYLLMGLVLFTQDGLKAVLIYFVIYFFMNLGAFLVVIAVSHQTGSDDLKDYKGLGWRMALPAVLLAIFLFSLTGLPPLAGFIGKLYLFTALIENHWYVLAVIGVLNSVIALYYYARVVKIMFLEGIPAEERPAQDAERRTPVVAISGYYAVLLVILAVPVLVLGIYWVPLLRLVEDAMHGM